MSEKSGYGAQIFILIIAVIFIASLSRIKRVSGTADPNIQQSELLQSERQGPTDNIVVSESQD